MGVTVQMADGTLIGAHFSSPGTETAVGAEMLAQIQAHSSTMRLLYCTGNLPVHTTQYGGLDVQGKANLIGFQGDAYSFDTSLIEPKDGTFVAVRSFGANKKCGIYYKRDEKVRDLYDKSSGAQVAKVQSRGLPVVNEPSRDIRTDRSNSQVAQGAQIDASDQALQDSIRTSRWPSVAA